MAVATLYNGFSDMEGLMQEVTVLFLHDGCASAAVAPFEVFRFAGVLFNMCVGSQPQPRFNVVSASIDGKPAISDGGLAVVPHKAIRSIRRTDLVFIPDAGFEPGLMIEKHRALIPWLRQLHAQGSMIAAVCSGVGILAATGLLDGRRATTHWAMTEPFRQRFPNVEWRTDVFITEDRGIFTGGGIYSSIDLSLYLVEKFCGHEVAVECAKALLIDMPRTWQTEYAVLPLTTSHADETVRKAEQWIQRKYSEDLHVEELASRFAMSPRTFERRFRAAVGQSPIGYLQKIRISAARRMLESGKRSIQQVSSAVGYDDVAFFRSLFKRQIGVSPAAYRERFGTPPRALVQGTQPAARPSA
jgi:transcriptional regulator GlxA family with amidase domain